MMGRVEYTIKVNRNHKVSRLLKTAWSFGTYTKEMENFGVLNTLLSC